ncbi:hypothetical protein BH11MYX1_BH11MYX1_15830 [soil metagenome]
MIANQIGPYKLIKQIGAGGMGSVWLGEHVVLGHLRAIKILDSQFTQNSHVVTRFINEARATAKLDHPNLVRVYHVDQIASGDFYIELEYLEGETLRDYLRSHPGPNSPQLIVRMLGPVASCMKRAHDAGIVHRDLKPENLFLRNDAKLGYVVKVLDLGIAQLSGDVARGPSTKVGTVIGTPSYMAPEQARGERVTAAADVYALGVIAYEMLTGGWLPYRMPNESAAQYFDLSDAELYVRVRTMEPIDPRLRTPAISETMRETVLRMIDHDQSKRPASIAAAMLAIAEATPTFGDRPDGLAILREVAEDLVPRDALLAMQRAAGPPIEIASASKADSRYRVLEKLGTGGMAEVFLAESLGEAGFTRQVAIKRVLPGLSDHPEFAKMFTTEAQLASDLNHPNIVSVIDFSKDASGRLFLVMEYVQGRDLASVLEAGHLTPSQIIYVLIEMLSGLGYAHDFSDKKGVARGIVHRDVSPHNVLVSYEGAVKLNDFGLAKAKSASGVARSENARGKVSYMSPEQCNGSPLDGRSDLFAVGVMLHEALTNETLFAGTPSECVAQIMFKEIPLPSTRRSRVPSDLEAIAMRLLERAPDRRYPTAEAVIEDLVRCADATHNGRADLARLMSGRFPDARVRSRSAGNAAARGLVAQQFTVPSPQRTVGGVQSSSRTRARALVAVACAVVVAGVVGALVFTGKHTATQAMQQHDAGIALPLDASAIRVAVADAALPGPDAQQLTRVPVDAAIVIAAPVDAAMPVRSGSPYHSRSASTESVTPAAPQGMGELAIHVTPWAMAWLDGKSVGQTPLHLDRISVGTHTLRIANEEVGKDERLSVTITLDHLTTIEEKW